MAFDELPAAAGWEHRDSRRGFEAAFFSRSLRGHVLTGCTTAVEDGVWWVGYELQVDARWHTRGVVVTGGSILGARRLEMDSDGAGNWWVDGVHRPDLDGCLDVDLESSAMTNTLPVHRLGLEPGAHASTPAAYVRAGDLRVERLDQEYERVEGGRYRYVAPAFAFECELEYDAAGLVCSYPGIAVRVPVR